MLSISTIKLLRIPFSVFLSPLYFFSLSQVPVIDWGKAVLIFIILHVLIYPASNGYNSYMDRDTGSIGGLEKPPPPSRQLFFVTIVLDVIAILLCFLIGPLFAAVTLLYIGASKAYSYRGIRLKKFPVIGYLTVIISREPSRLPWFIMEATRRQGYGCPGREWSSVPYLSAVFIH